MLMYLKSCHFFKEITRTETFVTSRVPFLQIAMESVIGILCFCEQVVRLEQTWTSLRHHYTQTAIMYEKQLKPFRKALLEGQDEWNSEYEGQWFLLLPGGLYGQAWMGLRATRSSVRWQGGWH